MKVADVDLDAGHIRFRPSRWRKLKRRHTTRRVPLWPQLEEILRAYLGARPDLEGLLFPAEGGSWLKSCGPDWGARLPRRGSRSR